MKRLRYFSLIELLVVLAIISIIISLLQPSIKSTLEYSHKITCLANLKSHGVALSVFQSDHDGEFPLLGSWVALSGKAGTSTTYSSHIWTQEKRVLNPYLGDNPELSACPSDTGDSHPYFKGKVSSCYDSFGTSYLPAAYGNYSRARWVFHRTQKLRLHELSPLSNKLVMADWPWHWNRPVQDPKTRWHGGDLSRQLNILFADGHASHLDFTQEYELAPLKAPDSKWLWW